MRLNNKKRELFILSVVDLKIKINIDLVIIIRTCIIESLQEEE